jgi:hypothetical protein
VDPIVSEFIDGGALLDGAGLSIGTGDTKVELHDDISIDGKCGVVM